MMVSVFETNAEFISFMATLPVGQGEVFCSNYLPSSLFPRDAIELYYEKFNIEPHYDEITLLLWDQGKRQLQAYLKGSATLCLDVSCISSLCAIGRVHQASPQFEVGFAVRIHVLNNLKRIFNAGSLVLTKGPVPFVFKLVPPSGVLIDVNQNVTKQNVQGIWIDEVHAYTSFLKEFDRLRSDVYQTSVELKSEIEKAIESLKNGKPHQWKRT